MKLYELSETYQRLQYLIEEGEICEDVLADTFEGLEGELKIKADNIACMVKNLESEAEMIKIEAQKQLARAEIKIRKAKKIKEYLKNQLKICNIAKIETPRNKIQIKNNPRSLDVVLEEFTNWAQENADHLLKYSAPQPNKTAIKKAIQRGELIPFVKFKTEQRIEIK